MNVLRNLNLDSPPHAMRLWWMIIDAINLHWFQFPLSTSFFSLLSLQNEYIKYPVLYELSHKYLHDNQPESNLPDRLEELKEAIRKEIRKELKVSCAISVEIEVCLTHSKMSLTSQIKEGAEKLREVAKDRRALSDVATIVKKSNTKLAELKSELHELESQIILTQGNSNGKGEMCFLITRLSSTKRYAKNVENARVRHDEKQFEEFSLSYRRECFEGVCTGCVTLVSPWNPTMLQ